MRLDRLEIAGFGRLRDRTIRFGDRVTVILGENESGKSTVHRALRAALYGVDAGGQGRSVDRSEWSRWQPWNGGAYGLALTYTLDRGGQYRVARRLDQRAPKVQVMEIGGGDVTDALRAGRGVLPGLFHLGIGEAVFCATACLVEDGLRIDAADAATRRVPELQQAIEQLADSGSGVTAAQAVQRLRDAGQRIGSERRLASPLGVAAARVRQLDSEIESVRRRTSALVEEQVRGRQLDAAAAEADRLRLARECAWLVGRLATLTAQRRQLETAAQETRRLRELVAEHERFATFPLDDEEPVIALGGEIAQAAGIAAEAAERAGPARARLEEVRHRQSEIAAACRALAATPPVDATVLEEAGRLGHELSAEAGADRRRDAAGTAESRCAALRREIAGTGLGGVPVGAAPQLVSLAEAAVSATRADRAAASRASRSSGPALIIALAGICLAAVSLAAGLRDLAMLAGGIPLGLAALLAVLPWAAGRFGAGAAATALCDLDRLCPGLDTSRAGLERVARKATALAHLHTELQRQEMLVDAGRAENAAARARIASLVNDSLALARQTGVPPTPPQHGRVAAGSTAELLSTGRGALGAIVEASARGARRHELQIEDGRLILEERGLEQVAEDAARRAGELAELEARLARFLSRASIQPVSDAATAVAEHRQGCAARREYDAARREITDVGRRVAAIGSDIPTLQSTINKLEANLRARGGDPADVASATPLDAAELQALEIEADRAKHAAVTAMTEAAQLRSRIAGLLDGLPALADLEDERTMCISARDRANHQLAAIDKACEVIEAATRGVHRAVAPRISQSIGDRLSLLTDARYAAINVDTDRFAISLQSRERPELVPVEMTSHGTRDQVSLLLRLALAEVFGDAGEGVPLLLDEPLLTADPRRRRRAIEFIAALAGQTQIVVTSSDPDFAAELIAQDDDTAVVTLGAGAASLVGRVSGGRRLSVVE